MCKRLSSAYEPSQRSQYWVKIKKDYLSGSEAAAALPAGGMDTLDLVPIGGWWGNGRKAGFISPFLLACYNSETEEYESKCGVLLSDHFSDRELRILESILWSIDPLVPLGTSKQCYTIAFVLSNLLD